MLARALWHDDRRHSSLHEFPLDDGDGAGELLVRSAYSLVSQGTERLVATGAVPAASFGEMEVPYQEGAFSLPVKYGYSLTGRVEEGPDAWLGRWVHLLHPHQDYCRVRAADCTLLPSGLPPDRACLASNLETALTAVWDGGVSLGDRVLVVGFGLVGALTARLLKMMPGVEVFFLEPAPYRHQQALGWGLCPWPEQEGSKADVAFHVSATEAGLQAAIDGVGPEGRVVEMSWYGDRPVALHLGRDFHQGRKRIISSQVSRIPAGRQVRWDRARRKEVVLRLLESPEWDALLDRRTPFEAAPALFDQIRKGQVDELTCLLTY